VGTGYKWNDPTQYYRYVNIYGSVFGTFDFGGDETCRGIWGGIDYQLPSYDYFGLYYDYGFKSMNNSRTRGGPLTLNLPFYEWELDYSSDSRSDYVAEAYWYANEVAGGFYRSLRLNFTMRPVSNLSIAIGPGYIFNFDKAKWVSDDEEKNPVSDPFAVSTYGKRYIFADLNYKELSAQIRVNWTFTPVLSLQLFVQPLFASENYTNFKELARPRSFDFNVFGKNESTFADSTFSDGGRYIYLDPDGAGPAPMISMKHPNKTRISLRGNAVLRWEYIPGSTLYLVWTQSRYESDGIGTSAFHQSLDRLIDAKPDNIFMLKLTYWIGG
jgi:hypothetical protein